MKLTLLTATGSSLIAGFYVAMHPKVKGVGVDGGKRVRVENWSFQVVQQLIMDLFKATFV